MCAKRRLLLFKQKYAYESEIEHNSSLLAHQLMKKCNKFESFNAQVVSFCGGNAAPSRNFEHSKTRPYLKDAFNDHFKGNCN